jgi:hypothetical protein
VPTERDLAGTEKIGLREAVAHRHVDDVEVHRGGNQKEVPDRQILDGDPFVHLTDRFHGTVAASAGYHWLPLY